MSSRIGISPFVHAPSSSPSSARARPPPHARAHTQTRPRVQPNARVVDSRPRHPPHERLSHHLTVTPPGRVSVRPSSRARPPLTIGGSRPVDATVSSVSSPLIAIHTREYDDRGADRDDEVSDIKKRVGRGYATSPDSSIERTTRGDARTGADDGRCARDWDDGGGRRRTAVDDARATHRRAYLCARRAHATRAHAHARTHTRRRRCTRR